MDFEAERAECADAVEGGLDALFGYGIYDGPGAPPERLVAAMQHAALGGGKRLRPLLVRQSAAVFGIKPIRTLAAGLAIELVHCYSLVHDDLPAMDDDDLRRGQPTVHKAFDEATAILAGDALLTLAFRQMGAATSNDSEIRAQLVVELADAAGVAGMVGGQQRDMDGEGDEAVEPDVVDVIQAMKTGALIRASVRIGAILGRADEDTLAAITAYGDHAGRLFQLADDILDATSTTEALGKGAGKDRDAGKQTMVRTIGLDRARGYLDVLTGRALAALDRFGPEADGLRNTARYFGTRTN
jgi:farnesyl diphosphate synthase